MKASRHLKTLTLLPLAVGVALSFALPHLRPLVHLEHALFHLPGQGEKNDLLFEREPLADFRITVSDVSPSQELDKAPPRVLLSSGQESPTDWLLALHTVRNHGAQKLTLTPLLAWDAADELELRALDHEIASFPAAALGITPRLNSLAEPLPPFLESSLIPAAHHQGQISALPEVNAVSTAPSTSTGLLGFRLLENAQPQIQSGTITIPLLARWNDKILPSLELASLIAATGHQPADVTISADHQLRIGKTGPVIPLHPSGSLTLPLKTLPEPQNLKILLDPEAQTSPEKIIFLGPTDPPHLTQSPHLLQHLSSRTPRSPQHFQRPQPCIEIALLTLLILVLQTRKPLALLLLPIPLLLATTHQQWLPYTPALTLTLTYLLLKGLLSNTKATPKTKTPPAQASPNPQPNPPPHPRPRPRPYPRKKPRQKAAKNRPVPPRRKKKQRRK